MRYKIIRFFSKEGKEPKIIRISLKDAQAWCARPDTRKAGEWFDGYKEDI